MLVLYILAFLPLKPSQFKCPEDLRSLNSPPKSCLVPPSRTSLCPRVKDNWSEANVTLWVLSPAVSWRDAEDGITRPCRR